MTIFEFMMAISGLGIVVLFVASLIGACCSKQTTKNVLETVLVGSNEDVYKKKWTVYINAVFWGVFILGLLGNLYAI